MFQASVWTGYYANIDTCECVRRLKKAGFSGSELSTDHTALLLNKGNPTSVGTEFRKFLQDEGFTVSQGHLSFTGGLANQESLDILKREIELFHTIGITNGVLHFNGGKDLEFQDRYARRIENIRLLQDFVKGSSFHFCLENLGSEPCTHTAEKLLQIIKDAGGENLAICLDTGHLHLVNGRGEANQSQEAFILGAGNYLRALHITENNGKNDVHQMPFSARFGIEWQQVVKALKQIDYKGLFNLEIIGERNAPDPIKEMKLRFIKEMTDYMLSEAF